jgi:hypothetical protein
MWLLNKVRQYVVSSHHKCTTLGALLLLTGIFSFLLPALGAQAAMASCRGDPIVTFTNGIKVIQSVSLDTDASQVNQIVYILHAPVGWSVKQVQVTGGPLQNKESFVFYADESTNRLEAYTLVNAGVNTNVSEQSQLQGNVQLPDANGHLTNKGINLNTTTAGSTNQQIYTTVSW